MIIQIIILSINPLNQTWSSHFAHGIEFEIKSGLELRYFWLSVRVPSHVGEKCKAENEQPITEKL